MPGFENLPSYLVIWVALVLMAAGFVQGALGVGFPMLATPLIAMVTDMRTAVILVLLPCVATTVTNIVTAGPIGATLKRFWFMPLCMLAGALLGAHVFVAYAAFPFALLLAGVVLIYVYLDRIGYAHWPVVARNEAAFGVVFGFIAGFTEGAANIAAPPLLMYVLSLNLERAMLVQVLNLCFTVGKPTQMFVLTTEGGVTWTQWAITLPFAALATATTLIGVYVRNRIDTATFRRWLLRFLLLVALVLIAQYGVKAWAG
ncbi:MAG: sulfite exporter TauE/SafE family protein [Betaproteobacteria bacterium]|nr:sulfite exporter TauE/SafE family protein [Betaproteobacteria bacterium]